jgi:PAS domain S-box-containing protein
VWAALLALAYVAVAKAGLSMDAVSGFATLVWPPSGIALAALLLGGQHLWPGIFVGAFVVNVWVGAPLPVALGIATGNTLEGVLAALALGRLGFSLSLTRLRDVVVLIAGALAAPIVSATCGVASLALGDVIAPQTIAKTWRAWWLGDVMGILVLTPLFLTWAARTRLVGGQAARRLEAVLAWAVVLATAAIVFASKHRPGTTPILQSFLLFPPLIWFALRLGQAAVSAVTAIVVAIAVTSTAWGLGPFAGPSLNVSLAALQLFMAVLATTALLLAAVVIERSQAEAAVRDSHALMRAMIEGTTAPVYAKDRAGRYVLVNAAAAQVLGHPIDKVLGKDDADLAPWPVARAAALDERALLGDGEPRTTEESVAIDGQLRTLLWTKGPYRDSSGNILGSVGVARDITEHKRTEQALHQAVHARDEFLFVAGHELRTPLCSLTLDLGRLERFARRNNLQPELLDRVGRLLEQAGRLNQLITTLLDVSQMSSGRLVLKRAACDLGVLAQQTIARFTELAADARCTLELRREEVTGTWDPIRIEQVIGNLLSNAIKYGAGHQIEVEVSGTTTVARLSVRDYGIGIAAADLGRIFRPFERAVSVRNFGGLGLGLFLSEQIVDAHGGVIRAESRLGQGATFVLELPRALGKEANVARTEITAGNTDHELGARVNAGADQPRRARNAEAPG